MPGPKSYNIIVVLHDNSQQSVGWISSKVDKSITSAEHAAEYLMTGKWWANLRDVAVLYKYVYCETRNGKQRSRLYDPSVHVPTMEYIK